MGRLISLHDKAVIAGQLLKNPQANVLAIGDLDDFFWPSTIWYGWEEAGEVIDIALVYVGAGMPVLLCLSSAADAHTPVFFDALLGVLPAAVYAHLNPGVDRFFQQHFHLVPHGRHVKMALVHPEKAVAYQGRSVARLAVADAPAITALFDAAYPGNFFDPRMLETGMYFGSWEGDQLVSVAGIHVYSEAYDVAAIGNVTTHPDYRGRGLAKQVMASLIEALRQRVGTISLNVQQENQAAIHAYTALGFETISEYDEFECYRR